MLVVSIFKQYNTFISHCISQVETSRLLLWRGASVYFKRVRQVAIKHIVQKTYKYG